jgi:hypothetical protein
MPLANVHFGNGVPPAILEELGRPGNKAAELTVNDVEVRYAHKHHLDTSEYDIEIEIFAHDVADRRERLSDHSGNIMAHLADQTGLGEFHFYVWILLMPGSFKSYRP